MDIKKVILYAALVCVVFSLWNNWQKDYPRVVAHSQATNAIAPPTEAHSTQSSPVTATSTDAPIVEATPSFNPSNNITVETDVLKLSINLADGTIVGAQLLDYPINIEEKNKPFPLLSQTSEETYIANSSLLQLRGNAVTPMPVNYQASASHYTMQESQDSLVVTLHGESDGIQIQKQFVFHKGSYVIDVQFQVENTAAPAWKGYVNTQLSRTLPKDGHSSFMPVSSYTGGSYSNPEKFKYHKVPFKEMSKQNLDTDVKGGWVALQQHYFLTAWIPEADTVNRFYTRLNNNLYSIGAVSQPLNLAAGEKAQVQSKLYLGPEITQVLQGIAPGLDQTVDYGWLWFLSSLIFSLMKAIYSVVGNWGWSIVLVTVLIKIAFYRLSATSYKSMASMRKLQPKLQALKERYGDDKAKMSQATMELYRQEKVNPLGGCLPILIQLPVFIALYWVLLESVQLRQAPFIFWINDLALADPMHVLPVIMGITMLIQQRLNPAPPDPVQAKMMMFLPFLFTVLFWNLPSGLVLYWIVNNSLSILQQWYITRKYGDAKPKNTLVAANK